jgi:hypothetical protein
MIRAEWGERRPMWQKATQKSQHEQEGGSKVRRTIRYAIAALCLGAGASILPAATSANDCAQRCYAQENSCRRATKDSPSCGSELTRCLQSCRAKR